MIILKDEILSWSKEITNNISWDCLRKDEAEVLEEKGSFIYAVFNNQDECLYVGETGVSLQDRFKRNGNAAHCRKSWYKEVIIVKYCRWELDDLPANERKLLEQAISLVLKPKHYGLPGRPSKIS